MSTRRWQNHIVYRTRGGHIYELYWERGKGWKCSDLSAKTNATPAKDYPCGYYYTHQRSQHVLYRGSDNHIHEIYQNPGQSWKHSSISGRAGAPMAASRPYGYTFDEYNSQQVVYRGIDNNIYELTYHPGKGWNHSNLTQRSGATPAVGDPSSYIFGVQNHVIYRGSDDQIHELYFSRGKDWRHSGLSARLNAPLSSSNPVGHEYKTTNSQHVFYVSRDGSVQEMYWREGDGWRHSNLTARTNAGSATGTLSCYVFNEQDHIVYRGTDSVVHELYFSPGKNWKHSSLSSRLNAPNAKFDPIGFTFPMENSQHVLYVSPDGNINELYYREGKGWKSNNLTRAAGAPPSESQIAGYIFSIE